MVSPRLLLIAFLISLASPLIAEETHSAEHRFSIRSERLHLKSRTFLPREGIEPGLQARLGTAGSNNVHFLVQLTGPATVERVEALEAQGIRLLLPLRVNGWFASARRGANLEADFIRHAGMILPTDKIAPRLLQAEVPTRIVQENGKIAVQVMFHQDVPASLARTVLLEHLKSTERLGRLSHRGTLRHQDLLSLAAEDRSSGSSLETRFENRSTIFPGLPPRQKLFKTGPS